MEYLSVMEISRYQSVLCIVIVQGYAYMYKCYCDERETIKLSKMKTCVVFFALYKVS